MTTMKNWLNMLMQKLKSLIGVIGGITKLPPRIKLLIAAIFVLIMIPLALQYRHHQLYTVSAADRQLLTKASIDTSKLKVTAKAISYNESDQKPTGDKNVTIAGPTEATGKTGYQATINKDFKQGLSFGDSSSELSFKMTPLFKASKAEYKNGQVMFPVSGSTRIFQTFKKNGIKEDIILTKAPSKTASWQWQLSLGDKLSAKLLPNGGIGIFSSSPYLFGNLTVSDAKSQKLVDTARKTDRTNLAFVIPAPFIKDAKGFKNYEDVSFKLSGNTLTLEARNLTNKTYPLSLDPSVVVSTNSEFQTGSDDGTISYPGAGNIARSNISAGTVGGWSATTAFTTVRYRHTSVAYNGYLYVIGGFDGATYYNDVQKAAINADGTIGTWSTTTAFTTGRYSHTSVAYNGYLYVIGGYSGSYQNDVQKAAINADGTIGTWSTTTAFITGREGHTSVAYNGYLYVIGGTNGTAQNDVQKAVINADGTVGAWSTITAFTTARRSHTSVAYNGYLYVIGGNGGSYQNDVQFSLVLAATGGAGVGGVGTWSTTTAFTGARNGHTSVAYNGYLYVIGGSNGTPQNDVQKAAINADGTIGTWSTTTALATARQYHTSVAYNGYLYVIGGYGGGYLNDVQKAAINADGTVGAWSTTTAFTTPRNGHTSVAYNGYLYVIGGFNGAELNDVQKAAINADGTVGTWSATTAFTTARFGHTSVAYNGYLYVIGGDNGSYQNDVQKAAINADGTVGTWSATTAFTTARDYHTSVAYNGYLYVIGGDNGTNLNDVQKAAINADGTVGAWSTTTAFTTARWSHTSVAYNGYLYVIGGTSGTLQNDVQYALIQPGASGTFGTVNTWNTTTAFRTPRSYQTSVAYNGYLYVIGGINSGGVGLNDVQKAAINADGTVGSWSTTTAFTTARYGHTSVAYNGYLYVIGGQNNSGGYQNDVQKAAINADGTVGAWTTTTTFTTPRNYQTSVAYNGYLYVIGGCSASGASCTTFLNDVQKASINADGTIGAWTTTTAFATARNAHTSVAYNGYLYVIGGYGGGYYSDVQKATINADGTVGTWSATTAFTTARYGHTSVAYNGYLYVIGGSNSGGYLNDVQKATINADGTVGAWTTTTAFTTVRAGHSSVAYNGYLYVIGGDGMMSSLNDVQYASFNGPAQSGHYERTVDMGKVADSVDSLVINGTSPCGYTVQYALAGSSGTYGAITTLTTSAIPGTTYPLSGATLVRYIRVFVTLNDQTCGGNSNVADITVNYTVLPPAAPTLSAPASGAVNVNLTPQFQLKTTDTADNYAQYKILFYQSDCSTLIRTIDQTSSQTGWSGQDAQTGTAYVVGSSLGASTLASHTYQAAGLSYNTTYCWKAAAIDPGGSNTFGSYSATRLFTTNQTPAAPTLSLPASGQTGVSATPELRLYAADADSDYLKFKIEVCSTSNCSTVVRTIDQTSSQTGWSSQSLQSATAYSSGQTAIHTYQAAALTANTQYWWRAYAIDPAGVNVFSVASGIGTFNTTPATQTNVNIGGGTTIYGGTTIGQ